MNQPPSGQPPYSQPPYQYEQNIARRPGLSPWVIVLIVLGACGTVGIALVAILAAILFPVIAQSREAARKASCMSNMKQLALGLEMYAQDYDGRLPPAAIWGTGVNAYVKNQQVFVCASRQELASGYAFNSLLDRRPLDKITNPAAAPMLFESSLGVPNAADTLQSFVTPHGGRSNLAFADGHVQWVMAPPSASTGLAPWKPGQK